MDIIEGDMPQHLREVSSFTYGQVHDKTYNRTCMTSKYSDQLVQSPTMARVFDYPSLDSPEAVEGTCDQRRL